MSNSALLSAAKLTTGLWIANSLAVLLLAGSAWYQARLLFGPLATEFPSDLTLKPAPYKAPQPMALVFASNPFDPTGKAWMAKDAPKKSGAGQLHGYMELPGTKSVLTANGVVRKGDSLANGKMVDIQKDEVIVQQATGNVALPLPSASRPSLKTLNHAARPGMEKPSPQPVPINNKPVTKEPLIKPTVRPGL